MALSVCEVALVAMILGLQVLSVQAQGQGISFSYPNDDYSNFLLLGDAVERHGTIELTKTTPSDEASNDSAGRILCRAPVRMLDPRTGRMASFSTSFSFQIYTINSSYQGDGLAFLVVPDNVTVGSYGEQLGAFTAPSVGGANLHTVAIEFDTWQNPDIHDPNGNHVGLDVGNVSSIFYNNASDVGVQLSDGSIITAWIQYDGAMHNLQVKISADSIEPIQPLIDVNVSLSSVLNEFMYVGFSASTGFSNEAHSLLSWTFSSWGLQVPSANDDAETHRGKKGATVVLIVCLTLALVLSIGLLSRWIISSKRTAHSYFRRAKEYDSKLAGYMAPRPFTYRELYAATKGFADRQRLTRGKGKMGSFFKGVLVDSGVVVAVKQVAKEPQEGLQDFLQEVSVLCSIRHRNLVPLQGWCLEKGELMLVYEFMPNDNLEGFLFDTGVTQYEPLSWAQRYDIVSGIAAGLMHLHEGLDHEFSSLKSRDMKRCCPILHRDVKCSNVMLDNNFNARLGDYGLGRLVYRHKKGEECMVLEGTFGYVAPEVVQNGKMSAKSDVFSYGIVALEVACGKRALEGDQVLVDMVWELERQGRVIEAADKRLKRCFDVKEMECVLQLGLLCSLPNPSQRPPMSLVLSILQGDSPLPSMPPSPPPSRPPMPCMNPEDIQASLRISIDKLLAS